LRKVFLFLLRHTLEPERISRSGHDRKLSNRIKYDTVRAQRKRHQLLRSNMRKQSNQKPCQKLLRLAELIAHVMARDGSKTPWSVSPGWRLIELSFGENVRWTSFCELRRHRLNPSKSNTALKDRNLMNKILAEEVIWQPSQQHR